MALSFAAVFAANYIGLELTDGNPPKLDLVKDVLGFPLAEELMFRLFPIATVATLVASGAIKGDARTVATVGLLSSLAFGGYHSFDQSGEFVGQSLNAFGQRVTGGALLYYLAHKRGVGHSYAAHVGLNASMYFSA